MSRYVALAVLVGTCEEDADPILVTTEPAILAATGQALAQLLGHEPAAVRLLRESPRDGAGDDGRAS